MWMADRAVVLNPVVLLFVLAPFQWITVTQAGGFDMRLPYLATLLGIGLGVLSPRTLTAGVQLIRRNAPWLLTYAMYLLILLVAVQASKAASMPIRQVFFLGGFVMVGAWLAASPRLDRLVRVAGGLGLASFFIGIEVIARGIGLSWFDAIQRFVTAGDLNFVIYGFFRAIFNAQADGGDAFVAASQKNMLAATLLLTLQMFRAGHARAGQPDRAGWMLTVLVVFVLLMLNSRTVLLLTGLSLCLVWALGTARGAGRRVAGVILQSMLAVALLTGLVAVLFSDSAAVQVVGERFSFEDASTSARYNQYVWALQRIETHFLTGSGYAELDGQPVHNLFLGAFMHAGLPAFLLVTASYLGLFAMWLSFVWRIALKPRFWVLPLRPEWVAALPVLPLFQVWVAGDAGHPGFVQWAAFGCFAGIVMANARAARRTVQMTWAPGRAGLRGIG